MNSQIESKYINIENKQSFTDIFNSDIKLTWSNLDVYVPIPKPSIFERLRKPNLTFINSKQILFDVHGDATQGSMFAIMGSSGSGKTTLLNCLAGMNSKNTTIMGKILVNGKKLEMCTVSAFVEQHDLFIPTMTVYEHFMFYACLLLCKQLNNDQIKQKVEEIIQKFGLNDCRDTMIGAPSHMVKSISGGERKRLNIATKVLNNPKIIFLDEPTSGLDSFMADNIIKMLKTMSRDCVVVCTIHQPSSQIFNSFDSLLLLSEGCVVYSGNRELAQDCFLSAGFPCPINYNPSDFYIETIAIKPDEEEELCRTNISKIISIYDKTYKKISSSTHLHEFESNEDLRIVNGLKSKNTPSVYKQFIPLIKRSWRTNIREPLIIKIKIIQTIIISVICGLIYYQIPNNVDQIQNFSGALFGIIANHTFDNVLGILFVLPSEFSVFRKQYREKLYNTSVYLIAKMIVDIPLFILAPTLFFVISYWMGGFNSQISAILIHWFIVILVVQSAVSYGYLISSLSKNFPMANSLSTPFIIPLMIFGGLLIRSINIPVYFVWISYISWFKYSYHALCVNQFTGLELSCINTTRLCPGSSDKVNGTFALEVLGLDNYLIKYDFIALFGLIAGFRLLAYLIVSLRAYYDEL